MINNAQKYDRDWDELTRKSKKLNFQVLQLDILEWNKLQELIGKFLEYATTKKNEGNLVIDDEFLGK